jgi:hypothetical protein
LESSKTSNGLDHHEIKTDHINAIASQKPPMQEVLQMEDWKRKFIEASTSAFTWSKSPPTQVCSSSTMT